MIRDRIAVLGVIYKVVTADLPSCDDGEMDPDSAEIRIAKSVAKERYWPVLRHEIGHAVWNESGTASALLQGFGFSTDVAHRIEEIVMSVFVPAYCDTLEHKGLLRPAKFSKAAGK